ncbi:hypothetical protein KC19_VG229400 [Ceratodon purpureus]|uniref:Uncharacterized protein n=1 Tax=Ceratodon purpureus TaxID=3225 RepID=A0A8T0HTH6_CERPU|nr:hypothetical protein KC19_VG229400 [Ceratodon purpureus]
MTVFSAAKKSVYIAVDPEHKRARKKFSDVCERLVNSWSLAVKNARYRRHAWEFKKRRWAEIVAKMSNELEEAEKQYIRNNASIDTSLANLKAVADLLSHL